jgi:hypothetical protein
MAKMGMGLSAFIGVFCGKITLADGADNVEEV